jgi:hypothetical protein
MQFTFFERLKLLYLKKKKLTVHLYALCWNDEMMLPHFFRHYDLVVDKYFIFDSGSTDKSLDIIKANKKAVVENFKIESDSFVLDALQFYNHAWKKSRGKADWIILCNIDELFYHPDSLKTYLKRCQLEKATIIVPEGYEMTADKFPVNINVPIYEMINTGFRDTKMDKPQVFDPNKISEINFKVGRHTAIPEGYVQYATEKWMLLHYKYIGMEYWLPRQNELRTGLREKDLKENWGEQYTWEDKEKIRKYTEYKNQSQRIL